MHKFSHHMLWLSLNFLTQIKYDKVKVCGKKNTKSRFCYGITYPCNSHCTTNQQQSCHHNMFEPTKATHILTRLQTKSCSTIFMVQ